MSSAERIEVALAGSDRVARLRSVLQGAGIEAWIVGGAVRDALEGRAIGDIDLAVSGGPGAAEAAATALAAELGGTRFELSRAFGTWRAVGREGRGSVDLTALRGETIEADLGLRDFTINAIAVPLAGGKPLDPTGGLADLEARCLRAASPASFDEDPLRVMRAARLAASFGLELEAGTLARGRDAAGRAGEPAGERLFAELRAMVGGPDPLRALQVLDALGATGAVLPELGALRGVGQSANHHLDVHDHTVEVLRRWLGVEGDLGRYAGEAEPAVAAALAAPLADELTRRDGIRFAAILHDIGKPATRAEQGGFVSFRGHDSVGAEMIVELCDRLRTSRRFSDYLAALTRHHLVLGFMVREQPLPRRRIYKYISRTGSEALDVTLLTIADRLSAQGSGVPDAAIDGHLELAREMLAAITAYEGDGPAEPLLAGGRIAELLEVEGPRVGEAVQELAAAQFADEVSDVAAAEAHLLEWEAASSADPGRQSE